MEGIIRQLSRCVVGEAGGIDLIRCCVEGYAQDRSSLWSVLLPAIPIPVVVPTRAARTAAVAPAASAVWMLSRRLTPRSVDDSPGLGLAIML